MKVKEILYANLEKSQAALFTYSLETNNNDAKTMYSANADILQKFIENLEPYLLH